MSSSDGNSVRRQLYFSASPMPGVKTEITKASIAIALSCYGQLVNLDFRPRTQDSGGCWWVAAFGTHESARSCLQNFSYDDWTIRKEWSGRAFTPSKRARRLSRRRGGHKLKHPTPRASRQHDSNKELESVEESFAKLEIASQKALPSELPLDVSTATRYHNTKPDKEPMKGGIAKAEQNASHLVGGVEGRDIQDMEAEAEQERKIERLKTKIQNEQHKIAAYKSQILRDQQCQEKILAEITAIRDRRRQEEQEKKDSAFEVLLDYTLPYR